MEGCGAVFYFVKLSARVLEVIVNEHKENKIKQNVIYILHFGM